MSSVSVDPSSNSSSATLTGQEIPSLGRSYRHEDEIEVVIHDRGDLHVFIDTGTRFQVSSHILTLASPVFAEMLGPSAFGPHFAAAAREGIIYQINLPTGMIDSNEQQAYTRLFELLHYRTPSCPNLTCRDLAALTSLAVKYDCVNAVKFYLGDQLKQLRYETVSFTSSNLETDEMMRKNQADDNEGDIDEQDSSYAPSESSAISMEDIETGNTDSDSGSMKNEHDNGDGKYEISVGTELQDDPHFGRWPHPTPQDVRGKNDSVQNTWYLLRSAYAIEDSDAIKYLSGVLVLEHKGLFCKLVEKKSDLRELPASVYLSLEERRNAIRNTVNSYFLKQLRIVLGNERNPKTTSLDFLWETSSLPGYITETDLPLSDILLLPSNTLSETDKERVPVLDYFFRSLVLIFEFYANATNAGLCLKCLVEGSSNFNKCAICNLEND